MAGTPICSAHQAPPPGGRSHKPFLPCRSQRQTALLALGAVGRQTARPLPRTCPSPRFPAQQQALTARRFHHRFVSGSLLWHAFRATKGAVKLHVVWTTTGSSLALDHHRWLNAWRHRHQGVTLSQRQSSCIDGRNTDRALYNQLNARGILSVRLAISAPTKFLITEWRRPLRLRRDRLDV